MKLSLQAKLMRLYFTIIIMFHLTQAINMMVQLKAKQLCNRRMVNRNVLKDFNGNETKQSNCLPHGDAEDELSYPILKKTFEALISKLYLKASGLNLDSGSFITVLEFLSDEMAVISWKPIRPFFLVELLAFGAAADGGVILGEFISSSPAFRSGKFQAYEELHTAVKPDMLADNIMWLVDDMLQNDLKSTQVEGFNC